MSVTFDQLSSIDNTEVRTSDLLALYSGTNGDHRKWTLAKLLSFLTSNFARQDFVETISTPGEGFTITVASSGLNRWENVHPTGAIASGSLVLPSPTYATDGQEILFTTTQQVTSFSVNGNGASAVYGAPATLAAEDKFKLRYSRTQLSWYAVV